jgi:uncharacterized protein YcnI
VPRRLALAAALSLCLVLGVAGAASAHVSVSSADASPGGFGKIVFRVPNEEESANTTKVEVTFPADAGLEEVNVKPVPGWTFDIQKSGDAVASITWSGGQIAPGEFQEFEISGGPLPQSDSLEFPTVQTYDDGTVVRWVEPTPAGGDEPEHPIPTLSLTGDSSEGEGGGDGATVTTAAGGSDSSQEASSVSQDDVDSARALGIAGIVVGAIGIGLAIAALARARSQRADTPTT